MAELLQGPLDLGALTRPGRHAFDVAVCRLASGTDLNVPLIVICGRAPGPCLAIVAGVHGDEAEGMRTVLMLAEEIDPERVSGALLLVPVANPSAFAAHRRRSPLDDIDLNRAFPGNPNGSPSERLAARLYELIVGNAQFVFTLHSWLATGDAVPHVEIAAQSAVRQASYDGAVAAGFDVIRLADWHEGLLPAATTRAGIPSMEAEIGGLGIAQPCHRERYGAAIEGLAVHLGVLNGTRLRATSPRLVTRIHVPAPQGGALVHDSELGAAVRSGDLLGRILTLHGAMAERVTAPCSGVVIARREALDCQPGDAVYSIAAESESRSS